MRSSPVTLEFTTLEFVQQASLLGLVSLLFARLVTRWVCHAFLVKFYGYYRSTVIIIVTLLYKLAREPARPAGRPACRAGYIFCSCFLHFSEMYIRVQCMRDNRDTNLSPITSVWSWWSSRPRISSLTLKQPTHTYTYKI